MKRLFLLFGITLCWLTSYATNLDSLRSAFLNEGSIEEKAILAMELGQEYFSEGNIDSSLYYFRFPLSLTFSQALIPILAKSTFWSGYLYRQKNNYTKSIIIYRSALTHYEALRNERQVAKVNWAIGENLVRIGNTEEANQYFNKAESYFLATSYPERSYVFFQDRGFTFWKGNRLEDAIYYLKKAIDDDEIDLLRKGQVLNLLGTCYRDQGNYTKSRNTYTRALAIAQKIESVELFATVQNQLGRWHEIKGQWDSAEVYFNKAILSVQDYHYPVIAANAKMNLARVLAQQVQATEALALIAEVIVLAEGQENTSNLIASLELGVRLANQVGDNTLHNQYLDLLLSHTSSTYEHNRKTQQLADNAEVEKNLLQRELEGLQAQVQEVPLFTQSFLAGLLVLVVLGSVWYWIRSHHRLQTAYQVQEKMREEIREYRRQQREQTAAQQQRKEAAVEQRQKFLEQWVDLNTQMGRASKK